MGMKSKDVAQQLQIKEYVNRIGKWPCPTARPLGLFGLLLAINLYIRGPRRDKVLYG